ncbi:MAG: type II/IV secretion system ATPase subunit [Candidatus Micrarchaeia archaeon]
MAVILTKIDRMMEILEKEKRASFDSLARRLEWSVDVVERVAKVLEGHGVLEISYPINVIQKPSLALRKPVPAPQPLPELTERELESYEISADGVPATVRVFYSEGEKHAAYRLELPQLGQYTQLYLDYLKDAIAKEVPVEAQQITDLERAKATRDKFLTVAGAKLEPLGAEGADVLRGVLLHEMYGLGDIEVIMADDWVEEVAINNARTPIAVYHRKYGWMKSNIFPVSEEDIANYSAQIGRKVGRQISSLDPILNAHLLSGDRVAATLFPISTQGNTITIRRFARNPWTVTNFISPELHTMSVEMAALLWQAIHYEMSIIIAGGTASGKTSTLNSLCALIPPFQRVITIEDTRELQLPAFEWNWIPMVTRLPNPEGLGEVKMLDLMVSSLRMRPDRIVLGEIRRREEAEVLFEAMHTGHSVYSTIHADTGTQVIRRLTEPPIEIPTLEVEALNLLVIQYRDRRKNIRKTLEICEIAPGAEERGLALHRLFAWRARRDDFEKVKEPHRLYEELNLHTGMTQAEIIEDQEARAAILKWMLANKLENINDVGAVMRAYYADPAAILKAAEAGTPPSKVL